MPEIIRTLTNGAGMQRSLPAPALPPVINKSAPVYETPDILIKSIYMGPRFFYTGRTHFKTTAAVIILLLITWTYGCGDTSRQESELAGTWQRNVVSGTASFVGLLTLGRDGSFSFTYEGNAVGHERSDGRYSLSGRDIKFENKSCKGVGRYRYLVKDSTLAFIPLADGCARRKAVLAGEWRKRETADTRTD